ncbi:putative ribonuclease H-like domain-containing protein [Rosa chinensis]|uniref:Putative ribonuclease H-like domain-containing protein n=1 Tax=Rosa chinensis TaxID=74649 RepID=A0A2P6QX54_ROSCH|nr:putative ribonuclease H-like domain-containing protein [Rosa chinensis]
MFLCIAFTMEDSTHLFVSCSFAQHVWQWLSCCFGTSLPTHGSIGDLWSTIVACGGVFRVANGQYFGGYCQGLGQHSAFFAELMGVIIGIEIAFRMGWHCIWLESDSTSVLACISSTSFAPPWSLRIAWLNCLSHIQSMTFHCSHVLCEGNSVADRLTNLGLASSSLIWHASPPPEISPYLRMDDQGFPYSRVSS